MTDRPTRRGFLAACSAAAAALGLTARATPARPPIPDNTDPTPDRFPAYKAGERLRPGDCCYVRSDGLVYTSNPAVTFTGGDGPGARLTWKLTKVSDGTT